MFKYLRWIFSVGPHIIHVYNKYVVKYVRHPEKYTLEEKYKTIQDLFEAVLKVMRIDLKINGIENLRKLEEEGKSYLLVCNHISEIDPLLLSVCTQKPLTFVAKIETRKYPFVKKMIVALEGYFLDRDDLKQSLRVMLSVKERLESNDLAVAIFPEGHRNKNPEGELAEFHPGSLRPAINSNSPILPVAIYGTPNILKSKNHYRRYPIEISFLPPIMPEAQKGRKSQDLAPEVREAVAAEVESLRMVEKDFLDKGYQKVKIKKGQVPGRDSVLYYRHKK